MAIAITDGYSNNNNNHGDDNDKDNSNNNNNNNNSNSNSKSTRRITRNIHSRWGQTNKTRHCFERNLIFYQGIDPLSRLKQ